MSFAPLIITLNATGHLEATFDDMADNTCRIAESAAGHLSLKRTDSAPPIRLDREQAAAVGYLLLRFSRTGSLAPPTEAEQARNVESALKEGAEIDEAIDREARLEELRSILNILEASGASPEMIQRLRDRHAELSKGETKS